MSAQPQHAPGRLVILATFALLVLIWGTTFAAVRVGLLGIPPFTALAMRFVLASAILLVSGRVLGVRLGRTRQERMLWLVLAFFSFGISYAIVYWCEQWVPSGLAAVLFATFPLFVAIFAHFTLKEERLARWQIAGALAGFTGVAVIFSEDFALLGGPHVARASGVMLLSPLASAVSLVSVKRWGKDVHPLSLSAVPMGMAAGVMAALAWALERHRSISLDRVSVGIVLYLALFGSAVTFSLYYWLLRYVTATRLSLIAYLTPLIAVGVGALVLHERTTLRMLLGTLLVVGGVALAARPARPPHPPRPPRPSAPATAASDPPRAVLASEEPPR